jgi:hypothetical protein
MASVVLVEGKLVQLGMTLYVAVEEPLFCMA